MISGGDDIGTSRQRFFRVSIATQSRKRTQDAQPPMPRPIRSPTLGHWTRDPAPHLLQTNLFCLVAVQKIPRLPVVLQYPPCAGGENGLFRCGVFTKPSAPAMLQRKEPDFDSHTFVIFGASSTNYQGHMGAEDAVRRVHTHHDTCSPPPQILFNCYCTHNTPQHHTSEPPCLPVIKLDFAVEVQLYLEAQIVVTQKYAKTPTYLSWNLSPCRIYSVQSKKTDITGPSNFESPPSPRTVLRMRLQ